MFKNFFRLKVLSKPYSTLIAQRECKNLMISKIKKDIYRPQCLSYNCWSCGKEIADKDRTFFCPCPSQHILPVNPDKNYFDLFGIHSNYKIDKQNLTKIFRQLMRKLHPDLYTLKSEVREEKKYSADQSSLLNKAYNVLMSPIERGVYMLEMRGVDYESESRRVHLEHTDLNSKILMDILELNEMIDEIESGEEVVEIERALGERIRPYQNELENAFNSNNLDEAIRVLSKIKYYENVVERLKELKLKFSLVNPDS